MTSFAGRGLAGKGLAGKGFAGKSLWLRARKGLWLPALVGIGVTLTGSRDARAASEPDEPAVSPIDWAPCAGQAQAECATLEVPLDYAQPSAGRVHLALARLPALDPEHKIGSLFVNPGGPGGSGVQSVLGPLGTALETLLDGRFDVIGFDPRGVGASDGLRCFADEAAEGAYLAGLPAFPYRPEQERPFFERHAGLAGICAAAGQPIVSHMSTADVARDLDLLRRAVGDARLTYLGFSYGTFLGETYANLFPDKVRALVLDGVLDPRRWASGLQILSNGSSAQQELDEFLRLCDEAGPACAFSAPEGATARYRRLVARLQIAPVALPDGSQLSYGSLIADVIGGLYAPEAWGSADGLAAVLAAAADLALGRAGAEQSYPALRDAFEDLLRGGAATAPAIERDALQSTICADADFPIAFDDFRATAAAAAGPLNIALGFWWRNAACSAWPSASARYAGPWTRPTSAPVLIVGNYFDGITPYADAVATSQLLPGSRLLSYAGWGHTALGRSACVQRHVAGYLLEGRLPPTGTLCPVESNPFPASLPQFGSTPSDARALPRVGLPPPWLGQR